MKTAAILALCLLAGCAGLNVSWVATASYNAQAQTISNITPGVPETPGAK